MGDSTLALFLLFLSAAPQADAKVCRFLPPMDDQAAVSLQSLTLEYDGTWAATIDVPHQYAFQRRSLAAVLEKFRTGKQHVEESTASTADYITQLSLLAKRWRVRWSGPAPICEFDFRSAGQSNSFATKNLLETLMDYVAPLRRGGRRNPSVPSRCGSRLLLLTCAPLMTSSHSEGSTFHNKGEAEVVEKASPATGALVLAVDMPRRLETVVEVNCSVGPNTTPASKPRVKLAPSRPEPAPVSAWERQLKQAQDSLFAQELFLTLNREAARFPWARASVATDQLKLTVGKLPSLNITLDTVGRIGANQKISNAVSTREESHALLTALTAKMLLRNQHRDNNPGNFQRREPPMLLQQTMSLYTSRQTMRAVGQILHGVAREVAFRTPGLRVVSHSLMSGASDQQGFTVHVHARRRTCSLLKSFVLLVNGTGLDIDGDCWMATSDKKLRQTILNVVEQAGKQ